jgi:hypothetical protein
MNTRSVTDVTTISARQLKLADPDAIDVDEFLTYVAASSPDADVPALASYALGTSSQVSVNKTSPTRKAVTGMCSRYRRALSQHFERGMIRSPIPSTMNIVGINISPSIVNPGSAYRMATYRAVLRKMEEIHWYANAMFDIGGRQMEGFNAWTHHMEDYYLIELETFIPLIANFVTKPHKHSTFINSDDFLDNFDMNAANTNMKVMLALFVAQAVAIGKPLDQQADIIRTWIARVTAKFDTSDNAVLFLNYTTDSINDNWIGTEPTKYFQSHMSQVEIGVDENQEPIYDEYPTFSFSGYDPIVGIDDGDMEHDSREKVVITECDMAEGLAMSGRTTVGTSFAGLPFFNRVTPLYLYSKGE